LRDPSNNTASHVSLQLRSPTLLAPAPRVPQLTKQCLNRIVAWTAKMTVMELHPLCVVSRCGADVRVSRDQMVSTPDARFASTPHADYIDTARRHSVGTVNHSVKRTPPSSVVFHSEEGVTWLFNRRTIVGINVPFVATISVRYTGLGVTKPAGTAMA